MKIEKLVDIEGHRIKVILVKPEIIKNRIVLYGDVLSFTDHVRFYPVKKLHVRKGLYTYRCQCDGNWLGGKVCKHIHAFRLVESTLE